MRLLKNKIIYCKTEDDAKKLMQIAEDERYVWVFIGEKPTHLINWNDNQGMLYFFDSTYEKTIECVRYSKVEKNIDYAEWINNAIEFTELFPSYEQQETKVTKRNTTLGEKILVKNYEDDDWQERYFLTAAHGYVYATATEDGRYSFAWKYGIKKEEE